MRFPLAALFFLIASFIFFCFWAVMSYYLDTIQDALLPTAPADAIANLNLLPTAFGFICAIFFIAGILLIFVMDALADEPETYYRGFER